MLFIANFFKHIFFIWTQADENPLATPNSSDTGFDEAMDISDGENSNT